MTETIFKGDRINSLTDLEAYIQTGMPVLIGPELVQSDSVFKMSLKQLIDSLANRKVYKARDLEHFNNGVTVKELIDILKKFDPEAIVRFTGDYGSETEQIYGFELKSGRLTIMTDLCSG